MDSKEVTVTRRFSENGKSFYEKMKDIFKNKDFLNIILINAEKQNRDVVKK